VWSTFSRQLPSLLIFAGAAGVTAAVLTGRLRAAWEMGRVRLTLTGGRQWTFAFPVQFREGWTVAALLVVVLWATGETVLRSEWLPGLGALLPMMLLGALCGFVLAKSPLNALGFILAGLEVGFVCVVLLTNSAASGASPHPGWQVWWPVHTWLAEFWRSTSWASQMALMATAWLTGLWTGWWIFRRQNGLIALAPSGVIIAVDVLNDPTHGVLYFLAIVWLMAGLGLLLRLHYVGLSRRWRVRRVPRAADTGWNFGEIGFEATAALVLMAFILPPLNQQDLSSFLVPPDLSIANFGRSIGLGYGGAGGRGGRVETGFSLNVRPWGPIKRTNKVVFEASGADTSNVLYWQGIALGDWDGREWTKLSSADAIPVGQELNHPSGRPISMLDSERQLAQQLAIATKVTVRQGGMGTIFAGGEILQVDGVQTLVRGVAPDARGRPAGDAVPVNGRNPRAPFATIDQVSVPPRVRIPGKYVVVARATAADVRSLRAAGTNYPEWVRPFARLYSRPVSLTAAQRRNDELIGELARRVVGEAGATTVYDQAKAIESFLRQTEGPATGSPSGRPFTYDLETAPPPGDERAVDYFLLHTHRGYCEYFASSMGVMLRSLGIPTRLVNGFGKGNYDPQRGYVVRGQDAHTWVEVYFPGYGWVEFEPTPDPNYPPIERPAAPPDAADSGTSGGATGAAPRDPSREPDPGIGDSGPGGPAIQAAARELYLPVLVLVGLVLLGLLALRFYLSVADVGRIWRRLLLLGRRYRVGARPADTPLEFGERLARAAPSAGAPIRTLAGLYTRACFRRGGLSTADASEAATAWGEVRRRYFRLLWDSMRQKAPAEGP